MFEINPQFRINRQRPDQSFWQLYQSHREFCASTAWRSTRLMRSMKERIQLEMENDLRDQIEHNINKGVLKQTPGAM